jgi:hypothetical protein
MAEQKLEKIVLRTRTNYPAHLNFVIKAAASHSDKSERANRFSRKFFRCDNEERRILLLE